MEKGYEETMAQNWVEQLRREAREGVRDLFEGFSYPICAIHNWIETPEGNAVWNFRDDWLDDVTGFRRRGWGKMCGRYEDFR